MFSAAFMSALIFFSVFLHYVLPSMYPYRSYALHRILSISG